MIAAARDMANKRALLLGQSSIDYTHVPHVTAAPHWSISPRRFSSRSDLASPWENYNFFIFKVF